MFTEVLWLSGDERDVENEPIRVRVCVISSVAVGTQQDGHDTTGPSAPLRAGLVSVACRRTMPRRPEDWLSSEDPHDWMRDVRDVTQTLKL